MQRRPALVTLGSLGVLGSLAGSGSAAPGRNKTTGGARM